MGEPDVSCLRTGSPDAGRSGKGKPSIGGFFAITMGFVLRHVP